MNRIILIGFIFSFFSTRLVAQTGVKGVVKDNESGETLIGVVVSTGSKSTVTDVNGLFTLTLKPGTYTMHFSMVGYSSHKREINVSEQMQEIEVKLTQSQFQLDQVVVSAGRYEQKLSDVTVSMEVLKPQLVEAKATTNLETIVEQVPGVVVLDGQVSIRGGSGFSYGAGSRVLMVVDDMPMIAADAGDIKWNYLPLEFMDQMEVIKGASSALFGSSALNGVIHVRTAFPKEKPETRVTLLSGVYDEPMRKIGKWWPDANPFITNASVFHSRKIGNLDLVTSANVFSDQGYRQADNEQRGRMNVNLLYRFAKIKGLSAGLNVNGMQSRGSLFFLWADADTGAYVPQENTASSYLSTRHNIDPFLTYFAKNGDRHVLRGRYFNTRNTNNTNQESTSELIYMEYQYKREWGKGWITNAGLVQTNSNIFSDSLYGNRSGINRAGYVQVDKRINRLTLSFGARGEYFKLDTLESIRDISFNLPNSFRRETLGDSTGSYSFLKVGRNSSVLIRNSKVRPVLRFGLNYRLTEATFLRFSAGQGYRFPTAAEKYVRTNVSLLGVYPNPNLQPEDGYSVELGVKQGFKIGKWAGFIDVAGFWTEYRNMMEFQFGVWFPDTASAYFQQFLGNKLQYIGFRSVNVGNARITGYEISTTFTGQAGPFKVNAFGGYTYNRPINLNFNPNDTSLIRDPFYLKYRFFHLIKGDVQIDYKTIFTGFSVRYNSFMINIDEPFEKDLSLYLINFPLRYYILPGLDRYRQIHTGGNLTLDYRIGAEIQPGSRLSVVVNNILNAENMGRPGDIQPPRTFLLQYVLSLK